MSTPGSCLAAAGPRAQRRSQNDLVRAAVAVQVQGGAVAPSLDNDELLADLERWLHATRAAIDRLIASGG